MTDQPAWSREAFERRLRSYADHYHIHHPFQVMMYQGELNPEQMRGWVANRFYYQLMIPRKDAALLANCPDQNVRQSWVRRILDHDGGPHARHATGGGIETWIQLGEACGLPREDCVSLRHVLPGVRFAVDAYLNFVRRADWREGVCSSLTELFAPTIHAQRIASWPEKYPWIDANGLAYFRNRVTEVHRDVDHALQLTLTEFTTRQQQDRAVEILKFKLDVLWSMLDAMHMAYVHRMPPYFNIGKAAS